MFKHVELLCARVAVCSILLSAFAVAEPVGAMILQGRAEERVQTVAVNDNVPVTPPSHRIAAHAGEQAALEPLRGDWDSTTQVLESTVPGVAPGTIVQSKVRYSRDTAGKLVECWQEQGWTPSVSPVRMTNSGATVTHMSSQNGSNWSARTADLVRPVSKDAMIAESVVDQFVGGQLVGRYRTESMLHRCY